MKAFSFRIEGQDRDSLARAGVIVTPHGEIQTPAFIPVGTQATVKTLTPQELRSLEAQVLLVNTYHLYLRPGEGLVAKLGGLHSFMAWDGPIITDSGGFQVFSLGSGLEQGVGKIASIFPQEMDGRPRPKQTPRPKLAKIDDDGVTFSSHLDGSTHRLTPEKSMEVQRQLGGDILLAFDECTSPLDTYEYTREALSRTHRWAERCLAVRRGERQALFGIVQGGEYRDLREESARFIASLPFQGFALGGSLGKSKADMHRVLEWTIPLLPQDKPRHLLGIGEPEDLLEGVSRGVDLFDCVAPTRIARNGALITRTGRLNILNARYEDDPGPIQEGCSCYTCTHFSRGYLHHLFRAEELLAYRLATLHNLFFIMALTKNIRRAILEGNLASYKASFLSTYQASRR